MLGSLLFLIIGIFLIYGEFSTLFHNTELVGDIGSIIGSSNIKMFGYLAYVDFVLLMIPLYMFFKKPYMLKRLEGYVGWILLFISLIILQVLLMGIDGGQIGIRIYNTMAPFIGKAGLWLFFVMIFTISIILIFEELPDFGAFFDYLLEKVKNLYYFTAEFLESKIDNFKSNKSDNKAESKFVKLFTDIKMMIDYIIRPSKKREIEEILDMKLDPLDLNTAKRKREYIDALNKDTDRVDDMLHSSEAETENDIEEFDFDKDIKVELDSFREQKTQIIENERSKKPTVAKGKKKSTKKVEIVDELEENTKLLQNIEKGKRDKPKNFKLPKLDFLSKAPRNKYRINEDEIDRKIGELLDKLGKFKIEGDVIRTYSGPLVTTFEFKPAPNVKVSKILGLQDDLAMALKAETIRIQAPIPGKDVVGIEIPNDEFDTIYLREILDSDLFKRSKSPLTVALGKDIVGNPFITDLKKLPHLLIAGTTGSGKSVGINAMILSLLYRNDPDSLKLIMIDPKMLEFSIYDDIPHLLTPVITEPKKAIAALANTVGEMERRYRLMSENKVKNIDNYNAKMKKEGGKELPYIVVIIDELADLMMTGGKDVEYSIARLAQMARAAGIHLIIATQRPSVDVVTGLIKANLPSRLSYRVGQRVDSKVILDQMGAESLLGRGDALFTPPAMSGIVRIHAPWNTEEEIDKIVEFLKAQREPEYDTSFLESSEGGSGGEELVSGTDLDPLYEKAKEVVLTDRKTSISYLQRKLQIGYNRSANIIDQLEKMGVLSSPNSKGQREIIV